MENEKNIYEVAAKNKFRFPYKGSTSTEDLFDLPVDQLDLIFKSLNSQLKQVSEESLLGTKSKEDKELDIKIAIIKDIVEGKLAERERQLKSRENKQQRELITEIINKKKNSELEGKSIEDLEGILNKLN
jgi:hypothetical protein